MKNKTTIALAFVAAAILTTSTAYAASPSLQTEIDRIWEEINAISTHIALVNQRLDTLDTNIVWHEEDDPHWGNSYARTVTVPIGGTNPSYIVLRASCDSGDMAVSGGFEFSEPVDLLYSKPVQYPYVPYFSLWEIGFVVPHPIESASVTVVCLEHTN